MIRTGDKLGPYTVDRRLKSGGMATLYLGHRPGEGGVREQVALKVIHDHLAGDEALLRMFEDEVSLTTRIHHPNVVRVEGYGKEGDVPYLAMEYVHGISLEQLLRGLAISRRRVLPELAVRIAIDALEGLDAAHELTDDQGRRLGVVHRDVGPDNILLTFGGEVKLIDFGVAKARGRAAETMAGKLKGKFGYMSPEQAKGDAVDRRTDVYALGVVLWELLTMRRCFRAPTQLALLEMVQRPRVYPPHKAIDGIPEDVSGVVMRALHPDRRRRPRSAAALRDALLEVCPAAVEVGAEEVIELLEAVGSEEIRRERKSIPPPPGGAPPYSPPGGGGSVHTLERLTESTREAPPTVSFTTRDPLMERSEAPEEAQPVKRRVVIRERRSLPPGLVLTVLLSLLAMGAYLILRESPRSWSVTADEGVETSPR